MIDDAIKYEPTRIQVDLADLSPAEWLLVGARFSGTVLSRFGPRWCGNPIIAPVLPWVWIPFPHDLPHYVHGCHRCHGVLCWLGIRNPLYLILEGSRYLILALWALTCKNIIGRQ